MFGFSPKNSFTSQLIAVPSFPLLGHWSLLGTVLVVESVCLFKVNRLGFTTVHKQFIELLERLKKHILG